MASTNPTVLQTVMKDLNVVLQIIGKDEEKAVLPPAITFLEWIIANTPANGVSFVNWPALVAQALQFQAAVLAAQITVGNEVLKAVAQLLLTSAQAQEAAINTPAA